MDSSTGVRLLLVEDNPDDARFVERMLLDHRSTSDVVDDDRPGDIESIEHVDRLAEGLDRVDPGSTDVVLLDLGLPDSSGLESVEAMVEMAPTVPVVVLTGRTDAGIEAIRRGAQDYLVKGRLTAELLVRTIRYAIERARVTRELRDRNHRLALANEIVRTDVRNDVSMIVGWGDQLRDSVADEDRDAVESLLEASRHAIDLVDTAAELMDVLAGDLTAEAEPCDLGSVLDAELDRVRREPAAEVSVDWRIPDDEPLTVAGTAMLDSVFEHLLSNAATHTDRDTAHLGVTVEATDDRASVSISDDGYGIPDAQKDAIVDPDTDDRAAMGAGLYFVTTVLDSVGGDLDIKDNYPRGTVVTVTLDRVGNR